MSASLSVASPPYTLAFGPGPGTCSPRTWDCFSAVPVLGRGFRLPFSFGEARNQQHLRLKRQVPRPLVGLMASATRPAKKSLLAWSK